MPFYQFKTQQIIPANIEEVWSFISSPKNLKKITPSYMGFDITSSLKNDEMYQGMIISYIVKPLLNIKTQWVTEITTVKKEEMFVDEQRIGPYKIWHHQHFVEHHEKGTLMTDIISYSPPFGILGVIANQLFIKSKLNEIFEYRKMALTEIFEK
jgi:ligand-binding SRPBCC domain-containing protein